MHVLQVRNVHEALPKALQLLQSNGVVKQSRNGDVLRMVEPVATVYERPCERVEFHPWRDSNPFFHFYEALWMLAGRRDVTPLTRYAKQMSQYSDDGRLLNAAYGWRWRHALRNPEIDYDPHTVDQLPIICDALRKNPDDRQQVLQIWDHTLDLGTQTKDHACNLMATFQVFEDRLNMVVLCRSNDILWGCYGANAVHFSTLLEYVARRAGYEVGTYTQISVNWHAYLNLYEKMLPKILFPQRSNPYVDYVESMQPVLISVEPYPIAEDGTHFQKWDLDCKCFVTRDGRLTDNTARGDYLPFFRDVAWPIVLAHDLYKDAPEKDRPWDLIYKTLDECQAADWRLACKMWMMRRQVQQRVK